MYALYWFQKVVHKFRAPCRPDFRILPNIFSTIIAVFDLHTKMCTVSHAPSRMRHDNSEVRGCHSKIVGSSVCNALHVTLLAPRIWNWFL